MYGDWTFSVFVWGIVERPFDTSCWKWGEQTNEHVDYILNIEGIFNLHRPHGISISCVC